MGGTLLVVDDSPTIAAQVEDIVRRAQTFDRVLVASNGGEGFRLLITESVDVVLCDMMMPDIDGLKFLHLKSQAQSLQMIPVLMLTAAEDVRSKLKGFAAGAADYVTKPFHEEELLARLKAHLALKRLRDELSEKNAILEVMSQTDELTGLSNRRHLLKLLAREFSRVSRTNGQLSFAMIDIDYFKRINDTLGHQGGDRVLAFVGATLRTCFRGYDLVGRYGGEEFGVGLPDIPADQAAAAVERLRHDLARKAEEERVVPSGTVTVSVGLASWPNPNVERVEDLIRCADDALYAAKAQGRNRVVIHTEKLVPTVAS